ncbi:hypothetical protein HK098_007028 [Nowakowskiella sp. JEL0407]|nr:hypothetical protein HK098_007028 [Nowakowskiella sp. JEL0407]
MSTTISSLPTELFQQCIIYAGFPAIGRAIQVCRRWKEIIDHQEIWRELSFISFTLNPYSLKERLNTTAPQKSLTLPRTISQPQVIPPDQVLHETKATGFEISQVCEFEYKTDEFTSDMEMKLPVVNVVLSEWCEDMKGICSELGILSAALKSDGVSLIESGAAASTVDEASQNIDKTLDSYTRTFWSSKGSEDPTTSECVIYKLESPMCLVSRVEVTPYEAAFQHGMPIYAPQFLRISIGFNPNLSQMNYIGDLIPVENVNKPVVIELDSMVVGKYIRIDLYGRYQTQQMDQRYYTCLNFVRCFGAPVTSDMLSKDFPVTFKSLKKLAMLLGAIPQSEFEITEAKADGVQPSISGSFFRSWLSDKPEPTKSVFRELAGKRATLKSYVERKEWTKVVKEFYNQSQSDEGLRTKQNLEWLFSLPEEDKFEFVHQYISYLMNNHISLSPFEARVCLWLCIDENKTRRRKMKRDFVSTLYWGSIEGTVALGNYALELSNEVSELDALALHCFNRANAIDKIVTYSFVLDSQLDRTIDIIQSHPMESLAGFLRMIKETWQAKRNETTNAKMSRFLHLLYSTDPNSRHDIALVFDENRETTSLSSSEFVNWISTSPVLFG